MFSCIRIGQHIYMLALTWERYDGLYFSCGPYSGFYPKGTYKRSYKGCNW